MAKQPHYGPSRQAIDELHGRGWTDSAIGRAIGRDSSLVHQVGTGKKPGTNLQDALGALAATGLPGPAVAKQAPAVAAVAPPSRRVRSSGQPARVRVSARHGIEVHRLPNGARNIAGHTKSDARFAASVADAMGERSRIQVAVKTADGKWVVLGRKGGMTSAHLRGFLKGARNFQEALQHMIDALYPITATGKGYHKRRGPLAPVSPGSEVEFYISEVGTPGR